MRTRVLAAVLFIVVGLFAGTANASGFFTDDDNSVHLRAIEAIADEGITKGCNPPVNDLFCPSDVVTREQMATFLVRALDLPAGTATFTDIGSSVHAANIAALATAGITKGCNPPDNTLFCPTDVVTREQMATFLVRALDLPAGTATFTDIGSSVHAANISALATAGITKGCNPPDNTLFCPTSPVTRAQMATFLARALPLDTSPRVVVTDGQDLLGVDLGATEGDTVSALTALLGAPTEDDPYSCPYFLTDPNMRRVRWGSLEVTIYTEDTGAGLGFAGWRYGMLGGVFETGGPVPAHVELPYDLELLDPIGDAASASGQPIEESTVTWTIVDLGYAQVEANGITIDPDAPITGVHVGDGFDCG